MCALRIRRSQRRTPSCTSAEASTVSVTPNLLELQGARLRGNRLDHLVRGHDRSPADRELQYRRFVPCVSEVGSSVLDEDRAEAAIGGVAGSEVDAHAGRDPG